VDERAGWRQETTMLKDGGGGAGVEGCVSLACDCGSFERERVAMLVVVDLVACSY
jgi:hypothetical protein